MEIVVNNLSKSFNHLKVIDTLSFTANKGEVLGILGPDGSGKATLMKILAGYFLPDEGQIFFNNLSIWKDSWHIKEHVGYLSKDNPLYPEMTVFDFLKFVAQIYSIPQFLIPSRILETLQLCRIENEKHKKIKELSLGIRRRIGLAQALIHNPEVLLVVEPTKGLDPNQVKEIHDIILYLKNFKTIIACSNDLNKVEASCDKVLIMNKGKIIAHGSVNQLRQKVEESNSLILSIKGINTHLIYQHLKDEPYIKYIEKIHENKYEIQYIENFEIEKAIFNICRIYNCYISELTPKHLNLEEIYYRVTKK